MAFIIKLILALIPGRETPPAISVAAGEAAFVVPILQVEVYFFRALLKKLQKI